ncbi:hypothetical protein QIH85_23995 [Bradyrhizobium japonicum]|uniref:hypothetical protein n=1 Tax=Bradyrhizobium japonicum TaxID=375 RepID=UPI0027149E06|nr:hypothetical protein [Bradyrhizobium japonicum]WLB24946.1 hypothetical protein QIH85_23995 [Bradyrhizobium japonicum]
MGLNFPSLPSVGTIYPSPAQPGVPQYRWDGEKWTQQGLQTKPVVYADGSVPMTGQLKLIAPPLAANDAAAKSYVDGIAPPAGSLRYDIAQGLSAAQQLQGRQNVYAAPFDAMAYNGLQVNGTCDVNQMTTGGSSFTVANNVAAYICDAWRAAVNHVGATFSAQQYLTGGPAGIPCAVGLNLTAGAFTSWSPSDLTILLTHIEGYRCRRLAWGTANAQPVTISFWVYAVAAGTATLAVRNATNDRSYLKDLAVPAAVWTYLSLTIPGDTAGTWETANGTGMQVSLCFGVGSQYQGTNGQWNAGNFLGTPTTSLGFFASVNNSAFITGLTIHPGSEGPSAARSPFIQRPFDQELPLCQRYFEKSYDVGIPPGTVTTVGQYLTFLTTLPSNSFAFYATVPFKVPKRAAPNVTLYSPVNGTAGKIRDGSNGADVTGNVIYVGQGAYSANAQLLAAQTNYNFSWQWSADARLT